MVLQALAGGFQYGFDVMDATGLPSGSVYPILRRLERAGCIRSSWEADEEAQSEGRPQRCYYRLTAVGQEELRLAVSRYSHLPQILPARDPGPAEGGS